MANVRLSCLDSQSLECPTVAYSGEIDKQKQAADVMAEACWNLPESERFELTHIIAPNTAHKVDPQARVEIERRLKIIDEMRLSKRKLVPSVSSQQQRLSTTKYIG